MEVYNSEYSTIENSYPNPFTQGELNPDKRHEYMKDPSQRTIQNNSHKIIEDFSVSNEDNTRSYMNDTATYPMNISAPQYTHNMKKNSNNLTINEILGTKQKFNYNHVDFNSNNFYKAKYNPVNSYEELNNAVNFNTNILNMPQYQQHRQTNNSNSNVNTSNTTTNISTNTQNFNTSNFNTQTDGNFFPKNKENNIPRLKVLDAQLFGGNGGTSSDFNVPVYSHMNSNNKFKVYDAINQYYKDFILTKTNVFGEYSVYKAIVECLLCTGYRYIVAIVKNVNEPLGTQRYIHTLNWISFQTRFTDNEKEILNYNIRTFPFKKPEKTILDDAIRVSRKSKNANIYYADNLPVQVEILKDNEYEDISDLGKISSALELYSTILTFTE